METRGLLSRISVRGTLTDEHIKSNPYTSQGIRLDTQLCARSSTTIVSNTERASCESIKARAPATVEYGNRLVRIRRPRAQGRRTPPDAGMGTRAFNAPAAFSRNPPVTGRVIGNRHPSCHSFCSLPHQTSQNVAGRKECWRFLMTYLPRQHSPCKGRKACILLTYTY